MITVPPGERIFGVQLPVQTLSATFVQSWERAAGPAEMRQVAIACDRLGYDWLGASDHVTVPEALHDGMGTFWTDCIGTLAWTAGQTERIGLLSYIYVLPYRHPLTAAKQFATLDWLSGGRAIAGIGAGHLQAEFERLGVDHAGRGKAMEEGVPLLEDALEHEFVDGMGARPRPVQQPRPPIWMSGSTPVAIRRAARLAEGWLPQGAADDGMVALLTAELEANGRSTEGFAIGHIAPAVYIGKRYDGIRDDAIVGDPLEVGERLLAATPAGVNQLHVRCCSRSAGELVDQLTDFAERVMPALRKIA